MTAITRDAITSRDSFIGGREHLAEEVGPLLREEGRADIDGKREGQRISGHWIDRFDSGFCTGAFG